MCDLSEDIWNRAYIEGWREGLEEGRVQIAAKIIQHMITQGRSFEEAVCTTGSSRDLAEKARIFIDTGQMPQTYRETPPAV